MENNLQNLPPEVFATIQIRTIELVEPVVCFTEHGDLVTIPVGTVFRFSERVR